MNASIRARWGPAGRDARLAITGWSVHVPGVDLGDLIGERGSEAACQPDRAHELLGRKGLLNKEASTRLALSAVHRALSLPPRAARAEAAPDPRTAVVASSNLGNVATVHRIARTLRDGGLRDVSPLDAPNASSNVIASTIAIWFRFGGPNLMICSGATSGLDAIALAGLLLRAGRADRVVVVGVEPDDEVATAIHGKRASVAGRLRAGAAAVVIERAVAPGAPLLGLVRPTSRVAVVPDAIGATVVFGPEGAAPSAPRAINLAGRVGDLYGGLGVLAVAVAAGLAAAAPADAPQRVAVICGDLADGWRSTVVESGSSRDRDEPPEERIR